MRKIEKPAGQTAIDVTLVKTAAGALIDSSPATIVLRSFGTCWINEQIWYASSVVNIG